MHAVGGCRREAERKGNGTAMAGPTGTATPWPPALNFEVHSSRGHTTFCKTLVWVCPGGGSRYSHRLSPSRVTITPLRASSVRSVSTVACGGLANRNSPMRTA